MIQHETGTALGQAPGNGVTGDEAHRPGVGKHEGEAVDGIIRVERQIGGAALGDGEQPDDQLGRTRQSKGDNPLRTGALRDQKMREPVGAGVEGGVAERGVLADHGVGVTASRDLSFDQRGQCRLRHVARGVIPLDHQPMPLRRIENVDCANRPIRRGSGGFEQAQQPRGDGFDGFPLEQIGAVFDPALDPTRHALRGGTLGQDQGEVEFGNAAADRLRDNSEAGHFEAGGQARVLERQHHLEQRVTAQRPCRIDRLDEALERQILIGVGVEIGGADAIHQLAEAGISGGVGAQHHGVDENPIRSSRA